MKSGRVEIVNMFGFRFCSLENVQNAEHGEARMISKDVDVYHGENVQGQKYDYTEVYETEYQARKFADPLRINQPTRLANHRGRDF